MVYKEKMMEKKEKEKKFKIIRPNPFNKSLQMFICVCMCS